MTAADVPLIIISPNSTSERRINSSWTISQLKARLEPITGVPASSQRLTLKVASQQPLAIEAVDETSQDLSSWPLQAYAEIQVGGTGRHCETSTLIPPVMLLCRWSTNFPSSSCRQHTTSLSSLGVSLLPVNFTLTLLVGGRLSTSRCA